MTQVTVVDASTFLANCGSCGLLSDRQLASTPSDRRTIVHLLIDQVEFADVLILNKVDLVDAKGMQKLKTVLKRLNPAADLITSTHCNVPLNSILDTKRYSCTGLHAVHIAAWNTHVMYTQ